MPRAPGGLMRRPPLAALVPLGASLLAALGGGCGGGQEIEGTIVNWQRGAGYAVRVGLGDPGGLRGEGAIDERGRFSVSLCEDLPAPPPAAPFRWVREGCEGDVRADPPDLLPRPAILWTVSRYNGATYSLQLTNLPAGAASAAYFHSDREGSILGTMRCQEPGAPEGVVYRYDVHLQRGWNLIAYDRGVTYTGPTQPELRWIDVEQFSQDN